MFETVVRVAADPISDLGGVANDYELLDKLEWDRRRELTKPFRIVVAIDQVIWAAALVPRKDAWWPATGLKRSARRQRN